METPDEHYAAVPVMRSGRASALAAAVTGPRLSALSQRFEEREDAVGRPVAA
jgi:hypothetical protein